MWYVAITYCTWCGTWSVTHTICILFSSVVHVFITIQHMWCIICATDTLCVTWWKLVILRVYWVFGGCIMVIQLFLCHQRIVLCLTYVCSTLPVFGFLVNDIYLLCHICTCTLVLQYIFTTIIQYHVCVHLYHYTLHP